MAQNWGFYTLLTELPTYMKNILHFDIKVGVIVHVLEKMVIDYLLNVRYYDTREFVEEGRYIFFGKCGWGGGGLTPPRECL